MTDLSLDEKKRYDRQIKIPEIGVAGQVKLKSARVLIAGLGGLGSVTANYLAAGGVGRLTIVDKDCVSLDNLNRQILYGTGDIGRAKTECARERLEALNPACRVTAVKGDIDDHNMLDLICGHDVLVDATDNIRTRLILNRGAVQTGTPFVFGGVEQFDGMATTIIPGTTPCLACLFSHIPEKSEKPGIMGPVAGWIASIQCMETIKLLIGLKPALSMRLLTMRGRDLAIRQIALARNPDCRVCGAAADAAENESMEKWQ